MFRLPRPAPRTRRRSYVRKNDSVGSMRVLGCWHWWHWWHIALRLMTWTNNFSKTFLIFASLIPFFRLIIPEKCFYQWILCHNFVYMKKFPWFLSFELGARQACDRRHRTMGTVHSGKISHLTWTFTKKYWAVLGCTGLYWAVLGHLRYLLGNVQVKWRILPLCNGRHVETLGWHFNFSIKAIACYYRPRHSQFGYY